MNFEQNVIGLNELTATELLELYKNIDAHLKYLEGCIIELESEGNSNE